MLQWALPTCQGHSMFPKPGDAVLSSSLSSSISGPVSTADVRPVSGPPSPSSVLRAPTNLVRPKGPIADLYARRFSESLLASDVGTVVDSDTTGIDLGVVSPAAGPSPPMRELVSGGEGYASAVAAGGDPPGVGIVPPAVCEGLRGTVPGRRGGAEGAGPTGPCARPRILSSSSLVWSSVSSSSISMSPSH